MDYVLRKNIEKCCNETQKKVAIVASPFWEPYITNAEFDIICYDHLDSVNVYTASDLYDVREKHERLIAKSDIVFVTAEKLKDGVLSIAKDKDVVAISNGVDPTSSKTVGAWQKLQAMTVRTRRLWVHRCVTSMGKYRPDLRYGTKTSSTTDNVVVVESHRSDLVLYLKAFFPLIFPGEIACELRESPGQSTVLRMLLVPFNMRAL
jgi:hypothetical protein